MNGTTALAQASLPIRTGTRYVPESSWRPPLDATGLQRILDRVRGWEPVDWREVNEGLDQLLGDDDHPEAYVPDHDAAEEMDQRFRGALMQLVSRGLRDGAEVKDPEVARLIEVARTLRSEQLPGDSHQALGFLRRLASVTADLVEHLERIGVVQGVSGC